MLVPLCMLLVLVLALATVALVYAIATAEDGQEDENGFHCAPVRVKSREEESVAYPANRPVAAVPLSLFL